MHDPFQAPFIKQAVTLPETHSGKNPWKKEKFPFLVAVDRPEPRHMWKKSGAQVSQCFFVRTKEGEHNKK